MTPPDEPPREGSAPAREVCIRPMCNSDLAAVEHLLASCPEAAQWVADDLPGGGEQRHVVLVAETSGAIVGMAAARIVAGEAELFNIAVALEHRRTGVGRNILDTAIAEARRGGAERLFLEVRSSNSGARAFYTALGFSQVALRRNYYQDPAEDALVLSILLN